MRAPTFTAIPPVFPAIVSTSPVCTPARTSMPRSCTADVIACAHRTPRAGPSNVAKKPSPAVSTSVPRNLPSMARTTPWCCSTRSPHPLSPSSAAFSVDPTMSVNMTVARTRSRSASSSRTAATKRSISSSRSSCRPITNRCSLPGNEMNRAPRICSASQRVSSMEKSRSSSRARTSVGTWIAGKVERTSIARFICESAFTAPGLAE